MTRWTIPITICRLVTIPPLPTTFRDFQWPCSAAIRLSQKKCSGTRPVTATESAGLWRLPSRATWITDVDTDFQLRLCVISHAGASWHRGPQATSDALARECFCGTLSEDVRLFVVYLLPLYYRERKRSPPLRASSLRYYAERFSTVQLHRLRTRPFRRKVHTDGAR